MADSKISGLAAVTAFAGTQEFAVNDSGTSKKISGTQLIAAVAQGTLASGYAQITASQGAITAQTDITGLTVTVTTLTGRRYRITACVAAFQSTVAGDTMVIYIMEGVTQLGQMDVTQTQAGFSGLTAQAIITPTAGAHTYKVQGARATGTGTGTVSASAVSPAFILIEDIGV